MSTTVKYKGNTLTTVSNATKTLKTAGKYLEGDVVLTDTTSTIVVSETYDTNGGIIKTITTTGEVNLQAKTITPTTSIQTVNPDTGYDGFSQVVVNAGGGGSTINNQDKTVDPSTSKQTISADSGYTGLGTVTVNAMPSGTAGTPTATKGTVSNHSVSVTPRVTNTTGYITGSTKTGTAVTVSASELVSGTYTVSSSGTHDVTNYASALVASGSATASATKGTVSNNSITVTPSVTRTAGYITAGSANGTAVTVSASELVSGSQTITENGTVDVTNLAEVVVDVSGGGSSIEVESIWPSSASSSSLVFSNLKGNPTSFVINVDGGGLTPSATAKTDVIVFDGTNLFGQTIVSGTNAVVYNDTSYSKSYSNGTLTIISTGTAFDTDNGGYVMTYSYGGSASNIGTKDVQVGSGATSITFTGLSQEPLYWSCIFKSNFGTSAGYQRVIYVQKAGSTVYGHCMDSATRDSISYWTSSYSNGSLTIASKGTNQGGYFHQPGYYQLTYAYDNGSSGNYQSKTVTPTTSQQVITADSNYDALSQVTVNAMPTMTLPTSAASSATSGYTSKATIGRSTAAQYINIPLGYNSAGAYYVISATPNGSVTAPSSISGTAASVSTGTNTLTLTKTVSVTPNVTTAGYISSGTAGNSSISLTASITTKAAATITPTTTNQTIAAGTYLTGTQTIAGDADLVGSNILSTANIFGVQGTVVVQNYYTGSSTPSSSLGSNGDIYLQI